VRERRRFWLRGWPSPLSESEKLLPLFVRERRERRRRWPLLLALPLLSEPGADCASAACLGNRSSSSGSLPLLLLPPLLLDRAMRRDA